MNILFAASEVVPFAKTGGLADVVGVLPKELARMGHDVRVVMPRYYGVSIEKYGLEIVGGPLGVPMGIIGEVWCGVYEGRLPDSDVPIYFIDHEGYFGRDALYNDEDGRGFLDNDNRFAFLSKAALQLCKMIGFKPDLVHTHDWHTAAANIYLNTTYAHDEMFWDTASVLTIHNLQHQGKFYEGLMDVLDIGWEHFRFNELEQDNMVNLLKGGVYHAQRFNTVSEGYAKEMMTKEYGWGMDPVIRDKAWAFRGILNGMDYSDWNPATDRYLAANFDVDDMSGKVVCKRDIQGYFGLPEKDVPLFGIVSRLVKQKGVDVIAAAIPKILELDVQVVMLGNGEPWSHFYFGDIMAAFPEKFALYVGFNNELAHKIEAGSDFFLMPSRFEPCGLNQMYSLRYGTPPIVRATGGLDDTIENLNEESGKGDGFKFGALTPQALYDTVGWATYIYYNREDLLEKMRKSGMKKRFTWEESAKKYLEMYEEAIRQKRGG